LERVFRIRKHVIWINKGHDQREGLFGVRYGLNERDDAFIALLHGSVVVHDAAVVIRVAVSELVRIAG
jgi:hypothetical protein